MRLPKQQWKGVKATPKDETEITLEGLYNNKQHFELNMAVKGISDIC